MSYACKQRPLATTLLAVFLVALLIVMLASMPASAIGIDDNCPAADDGKNVIISDESRIRGTPQSDHICGGASANVIIGGLLDDEIYGGGGADTIIGGHGTDLLDGGSGSDWMRGGDGQDCYEGGFRHEAYTDTVSFADMTPDDANTSQGVIVDLSARDERTEGIVEPSCALFGETGGGPGRALGQGPNEELNHIDHIIGSSFDDTITAASTGTNLGSGGFGDDLLNGTGGNDRFWGDGGFNGCTNDGTPVPCEDPQGTHRSAGAYVLAENRGGERDYGLVVLGAEGVANDALEVTRLNERQLRVSASAALGAGQNCTRTSQNVVDCNLATARYVVVWGDQGNDTLTTAGNLSSTPGTIDVNGGPGSDTMTGHGSEELLFSGEGGSDTLIGNGGSDALISEGDPLDGTSNGADNLRGGDGDDQLVSDNACAGHAFEGGRDQDILGFARQTSVANRLAGVYATLGEGESNGIAYAHNGLSAPIERCVQSRTVPGIETLEGTNQYDLLFGNNSNNALWGRAASDRLNGNGGDDTIKGQGGNDLIRAGAGADDVIGGPGEDLLHGEEGADTIQGQGGPDLLYGAGDNDTLLGGDDDDLVQGDGGLDWLYGQAGRDSLRARDGVRDQAVNCGDGTDAPTERDLIDPFDNCE